MGADLYHERWPRRITPLHSACGSNDLETVRILVRNATKLVNKQDRNGRTALHVAASNGNADIVSFLLQSGATCNAKMKKSQHTPLHHACTRGRREAVKVLVDVVGLKGLEATASEMKR